MLPQGGESATRGWKRQEKERKYKNVDDTINKTYEKSGFLRGLSNYIIAPLSREKANEIKQRTLKCCYAFSNCNVCVTVVFLLPLNFFITNN